MTRSPAFIEPPTISRSADGSAVRFRCTMTREQPEASSIGWFGSPEAESAMRTLGHRPSHLATFCFHVDRFNRLDERIAAHPGRGAVPGFRSPGGIR